MLEELVDAGEREVGQSVVDEAAIAQRLMHAADHDLEGMLDVDVKRCGIPSTLANA